jgi:hypothetical protein
LPDVDDSGGGPTIDMRVDFHRSTVNQTFFAVGKPIDSEEMNMDIDGRRPVKTKAAVQALETSPHFDGRAQPGDVLGLETGGERQLTDLKPGTLIQSFDVSLDGQQIIFDRHKDNADVVLINLPR